MAKQRMRGRTAPKRALIGPLVMLGSGMVAGLLLWRFLMLEPPPGAGVRLGAHQQLSHQERHALDRLLGERHVRP
jgi:hypothetical protein